jgi:hypothetical protein
VGAVSAALILAVGFFTLAAGVALAALDAVAPAASAASAAVGFAVAVGSGSDAASRATSAAFTPLTGMPRWRSSAFSSGTVNASMAGAELAMRTAALVLSSRPPISKGGTLGAMGDNDMAGAAAVAAVSNFSRVIREADCVDTARFMAGWLCRGGASVRAGRVLGNVLTWEG